MTSSGTLATGTVTFDDGGASIGQTALAANGTATFSTTSLPVGASDVVSAVYSGDGNFSTARRTA